MKEIQIKQALIGAPIPLFREVPAGFPSPAEGYMDQGLDLNHLLITHPSATFFVRVQGNSMQNARIYSGDILIVDRALEPKHQAIVLAVLNGEFTVKRVLKKENRLFLAPENPSYSPIEVREGEDFQVWGVVTYVIHSIE